MAAFIKGQVTTGQGKGSYFTSLPWFCDQVKTKLGFNPYPGTLNLHLAQGEALKVKNYMGEGVEIVPDDPNFCSATCHPVLIDGMIWGGLIKPVATTHPPETVEIIAPVSIRKSLKVKDGEDITFWWNKGPVPWKLEKEQLVSDCSIFELKKKKVKSPRIQKSFDMYALDSPDWVMILPVTASEEIIMVRQFRHGTNEITLELPGGIVEQGMTPEKTARTELAEEVGRKSEKITYLGRARPNPAFMNNWCHFFLAEELSNEKKAQDDGEDIYLTSVPLYKINQLIKSELITNGMTIIGFNYFQTR